MGIRLRWIGVASACAAAVAAGGTVLAAAAPPEGGRHRALAPRTIWLSSSLASTATGENDHGQIVGRVGNQAVIWEHGRTVGLGTDGWPFSAATAINDKGEVVGTLQAGARSDGFLWRHGKMTALGTRDGDAIGINDSGEIIGWTQVRSRSPAAVNGLLRRAVVWRNGKMAYLGSLGGRGGVSEPYAIDEAGAIAGWSGQANPKAPVHAVMWQGGTIVDLGVLAGRRRFPSGALAINAHGEAVGYTIGADRLRHPYEWRGRDGVALEVGAMNRRSFCTATAINDSGAVVGVCVRISRGRPLAPHAFLWQNGKATELTIRDRRYRAAAANWIDDDSHIFGVAEIPGGKSAIGAGGVVLVPGTPDAGANVARWRAVEWVVKR